MNDLYKTRDKTIDICRFIGIMLVVIGHSGCPEIIHHWIYLFHMSLFFALSGMCYSDKNDANPRLFLLKKVRSIYLPYVVYSVFLILIHNLLIRTSVYGSSSAFLELPVGNEYGIVSSYTAKEVLIQVVRAVLFAQNEQLGGATWFLRILFIVNIIHNTIRFIVLEINRNVNRDIVSTVIGILALIIGGVCYRLSIHLPLELQVSFSAYFAFVCGGIYKKITLRWSTNRVVNVIIVCLSFAILCFVGDYGSIGLGVNNIHGIVFYAVMTISGLALTCSCASIIALFINNRFLNKIIDCIALNSLTIVFWHFLAFKLVTLIQLSMNNLSDVYLGCFPVAKSDGIWWVLYSAFGVFIPVMTNVLLKRVMRRKSNDNGISNNCGV